MAEEAGEEAKFEPAERVPKERRATMQPQSEFEAQAAAFTPAAFDETRTNTAYAATATS